MTKSKTNIKGFRQPYIDEEVNPLAHEREAVEGVETQLVALLAEMYSPADTMAESTEQKTTSELIDEMESSSDVSKNKVKKAMDAAGFKLHYNGSEYVWLLKERAGA